MRNILMLFILLSIVGCNINGPSLKFPVNESDVDLLNVEFQWKLRSVEEARFRLYFASNLYDPVVDTVLAVDFFTIKNLFPGESYFWKLDFNNKTLDANFTTKNPLSNLKNQYEVLTHKKLRILSPEIPNWDTSYTETIQLTLIKQGINLKMSDNIDRDLLYSHYDQLNDGEYFYSDSSHGQGSRATFTIDETLRSIIIDVYRGSPAGGYMWQTEFNY